MKNSHRNRALVSLFVGLLSLYLAGHIEAATFCVTNSTELHSALTTAASNGENDLIRIIQGNYNGNFSYTSTEPYGVTIEGGYTANCSSRVVNPENTVIDAGGAEAVLVLSAPQAVAGFSINGVTLQNGNGTETRGSGLFIVTAYGNVAVTNNIAQNNVVGGAFNTDPAGIYISGAADVTVENNIIRQNGSLDGIVYSSGLMIGDARTVNIRNNLIQNNRARVVGGGAIVISNGIVNIEGNTFTGNHAVSSGGGLYLVSGQLANVSNNVFTGNKVDPGTGGGLILLAQQLNIVNNTIAYNQASEGCGLWYQDQRDDSTANIYNNLFYSNTDYGQAIGKALYIDNDNNGNYFPSVVNLFNNDFDQGQKGIYLKIPFPIDPSNLNNIDPLFVDSTNSDYHLQSISPCINAGNNLAPGLPATDKDGLPRIVNGIVDIGAYENQGVMGPVAGFKAFPTSGLAPLNVNFTNESTGTITSYKWKFGDGSTSDQQNPTHTYTSPGKYTVSLTTTGPLGSDTETKTDYITVVSPNAPDLSGRLKEFNLDEFGKRIGLTIQIANTGNQKANRFQAALYLANEGTPLGKLLDEETLSGGLKSGDTKDVIFRYASQTLLSGRYVIVLIDSSDQILETDETNNKMIIRIP